MEEYFKTHSSDLIYGGIIVAVMVIFYLVTNLTHKWILRVAVVKFDDSAVVIRVWAWALRYSESIAVKRDVFETVKKRFDAEGI